MLSTMFDMMALSHSLKQNEEDAHEEKIARQTTCQLELRHQAIRHAAHQKHIQLIKTAKESDYKELNTTIQSIEPLPQEYPRYRYITTSFLGFPEIKANNIYSAILSNEKLSSENKQQLFSELQKKGYHKHEVQLIKSPAIHHMLKENSQPMNARLLSSYNLYLMSNDNKPIEQERDIWKNIRNHQPGKIFDTLTNLIRFSNSYHKPMQFVIDWLNSINSPSDILAAHREIEKAFKATRHHDLSNHTDIIFKFAKQRILALQQTAEAKTESTSTYDRGRIELFLNRHRSWHFCFQKTKSKHIYDELRKNSRNANTMLKEEETKIETVIKQLQLFMR